jgi:hypothetical protein
MPITPRIIDVRVTADSDPAFVTVSPVWSDVDRPVTFGWLVKKALTPRLVRAIRAGAAFRNVAVATDNAGKTYVSAEATLLGRHMNADLKRIGF